VYGNGKGVMRVRYMVVADESNVYGNGRGVMRAKYMVMTNERNVYGNGSVTRARFIVMALIAR